MMSLWVRFESPPSPRINEVITKFGDADKVVEEDLASFGVTQKGQVYLWVLIE